MHTKPRRSLQLLVTDVVVLSGPYADPNITLIRSTRPYLAGKLLLPGGHVDEGETTKRAAQREGGEEVGLTIELDELELFTVLDAPGRDVRDGVDRVSVVYLVDRRGHDVAPQAGDDAAAVETLPLRTVSAVDMGYDHGTVVEMLKTSYGGGG